MTYLVTELIRKKRNGGQHSHEELQFLVEGFSNSKIPDYQISAWLMAAFIKGLNSDETFALTELMKSSGISYHWQELEPTFKNEFFVDKHSTGGVGDKVSLVVAPLCAAMGMKVPMMSGRGLGHTGGTVDKLESIPGFTMYPTKTQILAGLSRFGIAMMAQAADLCPADKKLYSLRDVTATIENVSLITASIVSKKWAEGAKNILYDVKCGGAAFMKSLAEARPLASSLVQTSARVGMKATALLTRMDEPLGAYVGHSLEVLEALMILENQYASPLHKKIATPLKDLCIEQAVLLSVLSGHSSHKDPAYVLAEKALNSGKARERFEQMVLHQGATTNWLSSLPKASDTLEITAQQTGILTQIHAIDLALAGFDIHMGRQQAEDHLDLSAGYEILVQVGSKIEKGQILCKVHYNRQSANAATSAKIQNSFKMEASRQAFETPPLILETLSA